MQIVLSNVHSRICDGMSFVDSYFYCEICDEEVYDLHKIVGGWKCCTNHTVFVKCSKFDSHCHYCGGLIEAGDPVVLVLIKNAPKVWLVLHPKNECRSWNPSQQSRHESPPPPSDWTTLCVIPNAPKEVVRAAYRALCLLNHPDHGGNEDKMKEINAAMERLSGGA